jgi:hypothetical protein
MALGRAHEQSTGSVLERARAQIVSQLACKNHSEHGKILIRIHLDKEAFKMWSFLYIYIYLVFKWRTVWGLEKVPCTIHSEDFPERNLTKWWWPIYFKQIQLQEYNITYSPSLPTLIYPSNLMPAYKCSICSFARCSSKGYPGFYTI